MIAHCIALCRSKKKFAYANMTIPRLWNNHQINTRLYLNKIRETIQFTISNIILSSFGVHHLMNSIQFESLLNCSSDQQTHCIPTRIQIENRYRQTMFYDCHTLVFMLMAKVTTVNFTV